MSIDTPLTLAATPAADDPQAPQAAGHYLVLSAQVGDTILVRSLSTGESFSICVSTFGSDPAQAQRPVRLAIKAPRDIEFARLGMLRERGIDPQAWLARAPGTERPPARHPRGARALPQPAAGDSACARSV